MRRTPWRRAGLAAAAALVAGPVLTGCDSAQLGGGGGGEAPQSLVASPAYVATAAVSHERLVGLQAALDELRESTGSGWTGRQDDVTGYLADLSGGRWSGAEVQGVEALVSDFMAAYGPRLFGIGPDALEVGRPQPLLDSGTSTVRAEQVLDGVPVVDSGLVLTVAGADSEPRLNAVRGRVFPDLAVSTRPAIGPQRARARVARVSGGQLEGPPRLVVLPESSGRLAWEVPVSDVAASGARPALAAGLYYLDAHTGRVAALRSATAHFAPSDPGTVEVRGESPDGDSLTARGLRTEQGVLLKDTTTPGYDAATGEGGVQTFDMGGLTESSRPFPGVPYIDDDTEIDDPDAIAAQSYSRAVHDYFAQVMGQNSWDGKGASLEASIHYGPPDLCNAFFDPVNGVMAFGNPCVQDGEQVTSTMIALDVTAHEITHGVTGTSSDLIYSGQPGALNESFSDYFGNVIENLLTGRDTAALGEDLCAGLPGETAVCRADPAGGLSTRYLLNGNDFEDYLTLLDPPLRVEQLGYSSQDQGGVHLNSSIWNDTLWSIRSRLAQIEGTTGNESSLAADFDKIVFHALTQLLGPTSGFVDARRAIEQTIVAAGADPLIGQVAREVFELRKICTGCSELSHSPGVLVTESTATDVSPAVSGDRVAWVSESAQVLGVPSVATIGGTSAPVTTAPDTAQVAWAGESLVALEFPGGRVPGRVVRHDLAGSSAVVGTATMSTNMAGLAGSADGAAWLSAEDGSVHYLDTTGQVTTARLPELQQDEVTSLGAGAGTVVLGTASGRVLTWRPAGDPTGLTELGRVGGAVVAAAAHGDRVLVIDKSGGATLLDVAAAPVVLSQNARHFGAAIDDRYAVWTEAAGTLEGGVAEALGGVSGSQLYLHSAETGQVYDLMDTRGQQGFPALSGDRLVWQDAVRGGDDVFTATIPAGL